ncbi:hypothetical protein SteCoe_24232 [Stentor coeruleus]|uniref:Uncharacterized protein n=1 Tax=Stentor coeruleus TaxID=5963 RepID=A0A1R2BI08_9CILI|nr:hypothetical protein SteCoe_24232 [Stentor coeruleus]
MKAPEIINRYSDFSQTSERVSNISLSSQPFSKLHKSINSSSKKVNIIEKMIKDIKQMRYIKGYHEAMIIAKKLKMENNKGNVFERLFHHAEIKQAMFEHMNKIRENSNLSPKSALKRTSNVFNRLYESSELNLSCIRSESQENRLSLTPRARKSSLKVYFNLTSSLPSSNKSSPTALNQSQKSGEPSDSFSFHEDFSRTLKKSFKNEQKSPKCQTARVTTKKKVPINKMLAKNLLSKMSKSNPSMVRNNAKINSLAKVKSSDIPISKQNMKISITTEEEFLERERMKLAKLKEENDEIEKAYGIPRVVN